MKARGPNTADRRAGFTLIEALVALALVLAFASVLGPLMFNSRRILTQGDGQVRAELLLRTLLEMPIARDHPELGSRDGESGGLRWSVTVEPAFSDALFVESAEPDPKKGKQKNWSLLRLTARVFWGSGKIVTAQTLRLADVD